jgi:hypothetical protein
LTHALLNTSIVVDQTTASAPGEMMCDGVNGWRRSDCSGAAVEKTQITKMAPHESALMAPGAGAAMTEACHVPLDRRGTPRTCYLVADKFGFANCQTVAPPALGDMQKGRAAVPGGATNAQSRSGRYCLHQIGNNTQIAAMPRTTNPANESQTSMSSRVMFGFCKMDVGTQPLRRREGLRLAVI